MDINTNEIRTINAFALKELAATMQISDEELDNHIKRVRDKMMETQDLRISEVLPVMIKGCNMDDVMTGVILAIFASDYYLDQYMNGDIIAD
jgi:hypothetical protein